MLWLVALAPTLGAARDAAPAPFDVVVRVHWGDDSVGPESLREEVERSVVRQLDRAACFDSLTRYAVGEPQAEDDGDADLLFSIEIRNLEVREEWDVSVSERTSPNQQPSATDDDLTATVAFDLIFDLALLPEELSLKRKRLHHEKSYRPEFGEDPREHVREEVIQDLSRSARSFVCKGTRKLIRGIEQARAASD